MPTFPAVYYTFTTKYPENGLRVALAGSYSFTAGPTAPDQRIFNLKLQGMQYFVTPAGALDLVTEASRNLAAFEAFYRTVYLFVAFDFTHPVYGLLKVKFNRPLEIPEGIQNGNGMIEDLEIELLEQP